MVASRAMGACEKTQASGSERWCWHRRLCSWLGPGKAGGRQKAFRTAARRGRMPLEPRLAAASLGRARGRAASRPLGGTPGARRALLRRAFGRLGTGLLGRLLGSGLLGPSHFRGSCVCSAEPPLLIAPSGAQMREARTRHGRRTGTPAARAVAERRFPGGLALLAHASGRH